MLISFEDRKLCLVEEAAAARQLRSTFSTPQHLERTCSKKGEVDRPLATHLLIQPKASVPRGYFTLRLDTIISGFLFLLF
jgi:hypothetical protein